MQDMERIEKLEKEVRAGGEVFYNDYKNATEARKFVLINV